MNIYELHLGSWRTNTEDENGWYAYDEIAEPLVDYLKASGYNYVEFMPLSEHPCDESWGYQNTGFYSPTSRYGTAAQLMALVDILHQNDIGVILDFVPIHFAVDDYGLAHYDGTALYEYPHEAVGVSEWGSCNFMHSRERFKASSSLRQTIGCVTITSMVYVWMPLAAFFIGRGMKLEGSMPMGWNSLKP